MFSEFLSYLCLYGIQNNIMLSNATGATQFQREKRYLSFRLISTAFLILGIVVCAMISYLLYNFVYAKFDLFYISTTVTVFFVGIYNLVVSFIFTKISNFQRFLYETSFAYVMDFAFTLSVVLTLNMTLPIMSFVMAVLAIIIVVLIMNLFLGFFIEGINRSYLKVNYRNVPARLFLMAIFSLLIFYIGKLIA